MEKQNRGVDHAQINAHAKAKAYMDPLHPPPSPETLVEGW